MKKTIYLLFFGFMLSTLSVFANEPAKEPSTTENAATSVVVSKESKLSKSEVKFLAHRLREIKKMDKSEMTADQKFQLKQEVLSIKEKLKDQAGVGIYLSGTAILIIILLIILL